jgi:hypothetical protein
MKTTILRDTNYSFVEIIGNEQGKQFSRKLEKGGTEYSNACLAFHKANIELKIGKKIEK